MQEKQNHMQAHWKTLALLNGSSPDWLSKTVGGSPNVSLSEDGLINLLPTLQQCSWEGEAHPVRMQLLQVDLGRFGLAFLPWQPSRLYRGKFGKRETESIQQQIIDAVRIRVTSQRRREREGEGERERILAGAKHLAEIINWCSMCISFSVFLMA